MDGNQPMPENILNSNGSEASRYAELSLWCISEADNYLRRGNNIQASEKGWGAVAQALKAIAEERSWNHGGHRRIVDVVKQVADELDRQDLISLFGTAQALHTNFYEDWLDSDIVENYLDDVRKLRFQLEQIRSEPTPSFTPETREQRNRLQRLRRG